MRGAQAGAGGDPGRGFEFPLRRIVANLASASLRKAGPGFDLAIAAAPLIASGELVIALDSLAQLAALAAGEWAPARPEQLPLRLTAAPGGPDLADLRGQPHLRYVLEVAAAGGHSLLMVGPPGAGKSLAALRLHSILPPLSRDEALEVVRIASACGRLGAFSGRPFRAPDAARAAQDRRGLDRPGRRGAAAARAASRWWPPPTPVPAGAATRTRSAAARRSPRSATSRS